MCEVELKPSACAAIAVDCGCGAGAHRRRRLRRGPGEDCPSGKTDPDCREGGGWNQRESKRRLSWGRIAMINGTFFSRNRTMHIELGLPLSHRFVFE